MNSRKEKIWEAARHGDKETISRLLPEATAEDLQYEAKQEVIIQYYIFVFLSTIFYYYCVYIPYIPYIY